MLVAIKAAVPDKTGKFSQPARQTGKEQKADDEVDWQAELSSWNTPSSTPGRLARIFHQLAPFQPTLIGTFLDRAWLDSTW